MFKFFIYRFKSLISEKTLIFWSMVFPIILVSFFNLAFSNIDSSTIFEPFDVAVVGNKDAQVIKVMGEVKYDDQKTFKIKELSKEESISLLEEKKIAGIVEVKKDDEVNLIINDNGSKQLLLQEFLSNYEQKKDMIEEVLTKKPELYQTGWLNNLDFTNDYIKEKPINEKSNNQMIVSFYSAIAMACLYGAFISASGISTIQPNITMQGARLSVSPYRKSKIIIADFIASLIIVLLSLALLMLYMHYVINIDFGDQLSSLLIICFIGALVSTAFGYFLSLLFKKKQGLTIALIISITMLWSFLAGMMGPGIKHELESIVPIIKYLNPVALITDSFYTVYYYNDFTMCYPYLGTLLIMFAVFMIGAIILLRGDQYDSI